MNDEEKWKAWEALSPEDKIMRLTQALLWIDHYEPEHVSGVEERFGIVLRNPDWYRITEAVKKWE